MSSGILYYEFNMKLLTKYINKELRSDPRVKNWGFSLDEFDKHMLVVWIDYLGDLHSRDMYDLGPYDIDELQDMFDTYYGKHLDELAAFMSNDKAIIKKGE